MDISDLLIETHAGLKRQGPGSEEMTMKALSFLNNLENISHVADLGCGTGGQTMLLAENLSGKITGVDLMPKFIDVFNDNARKLNLQNRVKGIVGSILDLPFAKEELNLIWSEGVIDSIGFETGLSYWQGFLKKNGYVVVSCPSWLTAEYPAEVDKFWLEAGSGLNTVSDNISILQKCGFGFIASFVLPEKCWTDNYFAPRQAAEKILSEKYPGNKTVKDFVTNMEREVELYSKYKQYYGYVFYIGKKI